MNKIAIFHELHAGGARRSINEFAKRLKIKHEVDLYITDEEFNALEQNFFNEINFYKFIPKKWAGGNWKAKLYKDTIELYKLYNLHKKIAQTINSKNYDLVLIEPSKFTQSPFILKFIQTQKIYYCQEPLRMVYESIFEIKKGLPLHKYYYERLNRYIKKRIDKANITQANLILANSEYTRQNIKSAYGLNSVVCYLGVDTKIFKQVKIKKDIDLLFIGAYDNSDGYDLLEETKKYLNTKTAIKVHHPQKQWVTDMTLVNLYCRSKIALCLAHNEPFGLIPIEAMACGTPVIAVNEGGYKESVINGKTGILIPRDARNLAQKINYLLANPAILIKLAKNGQKDMKKKWDWDIKTASLEKILQNSITKV